MCVGILARHRQKPVISQGTQGMLSALLKKAYIGISKDRGSHEETMELDLLAFMLATRFAGSSRLSGNLRNYIPIACVTILNDEGN